MPVAAHVTFPMLRPLPTEPTAHTLQLDDKRTAIKVTDSKHTARDTFLPVGQLPETAGSNPLLDLWEKHFAIEIFYFAASSLEITDIGR